LKSQASHNLTDKSVKTYPSKKSHEIQTTLRT
jgi:hypothetical protein